MCEFNLCGPIAMFNMTGCLAPPPRFLIKSPDGGSILITCAPRSAKANEQAGPTITEDKSTTPTLLKGPSLFSCGLIQSPLSPICAAKELHLTASLLMNELNCSGVLPMISEPSSVSLERMDGIFKTSMMPW